MHRASREPLGLRSNTAAAAAAAAFFKAGKMTEVENEAPTKKKASLLNL